MAASLIFCVVVVICGTYDVTGDDVYVEETSSLRERLDQLERVVNGLNAVVHQQDADLSRIKSVLRDHKETIRQQSTKLSQQGRLIHQLQQNLRMLRSSEANNPAKENTWQTADKALAGETLKSRRKSSEVSQAGKTDVTPAQAHDVMPRSDDAEPLAAVVSQMSQRVTEMNAELQSMKNSNLQQDQNILNALTSTFVHWGSSQCSNKSQLVYSGVVGGAEYTHSGSATNYLCLTMSPVPSGHSPPGVIASLYGAEYETYDSHMNKDPVCAVCRSSYPTTIMIPGTNVCTAGWHLHYSGFLMAGYPAHVAGSQFICVDSRLESRPGTTRNDNGKLLYYTATKCGSLPCDPYVNNKTVTCVVCSQ